MINDKTLFYLAKKHIDKKRNNDNNQCLLSAYHLCACFTYITSFNLYNPIKEVIVGAHFTGVETDARKPYKVRVDLKPSTI